MKLSFKKQLGFLVFVITVFISLAFVEIEESLSYKCMIQMKNYSGEKAYVVVSLINAEGNYEKTLYVQGDDEEWFPDLKKWWSFQEPKNENIDGITGATIGNGERNIISLNLNKAYLDAGYKLIFESAVENQNYHHIDVEIPLNSAELSTKFEGKGYIRYVRMASN